MSAKHPPLFLPEPPGPVLLHTCCAPCSAAIIEWMLARGVRPTLYFCNPNIAPLGEYLRRKDECLRHARSLGLAVVDADYDHAAWLRAVRGLEREPERGARCLECFRLRLAMAARHAAANGFSWLTTTLASSRWKDLAQIDRAGREAVAPWPSVGWWGQNWRRGGLTERRAALLRQHGFYNQQYCGCEFSHRAAAPGATDSPAPSR